MTVSCDVLQAALSPDLASEGVFSSVSCKKSGSGCACVFTLAQQTGGSTGTYTTTAAGDYTETNSDGDVTSGTYCVSGNTLTEHVVDTGFSGTLILTKS